MCLTLSFGPWEFSPECRKVFLGGGCQMGDVADIKNDRCNRMYYILGVLN